MGMIRGIGLLAAYAVGAVFVTACWTEYAGTETFDNRYSSIVAISDGTAPIPFVRRRLVFDVARAVVKLVPDAAWRAVEGSPPVKDLARRFDWPEADLPILLTTTALIALSVFGFMLVARATVARLYRTPPWLPGLAGLVLGLMLMGGGGDRHYQWYPYDFPNAFVTSLTLAGFLAGSPWAYLSFAAACYSKETAFTLILARWLLLQDRRAWRAYVPLAVMAAFFVLVQFRLRMLYHSVDGEGFWMFKRNMGMLAKFVLFQSWVLIAWGVCLVRIGKAWGQFPRQLRRLSAIPLLLVSAGVFKGWLEEHRQYAECLLIFGPMLLQWALIELGLGRWMEPRDAGPVDRESSRGMEPGADGREIRVDQDSSSPVASEPAGATESRGSHHHRPLADHAAVGPESTDRHFA